MRPASGGARRLGGGARHRRCPENGRDLRRRPGRQGCSGRPCGLVGLRQPRPAAARLLRRASPFRRGQPRRHHPPFTGDCSTLRIQHSKRDQEWQGADRHRLRPASLDLSRHGAESLASARPHRRLPGIPPGLSLQRCRPRPADRQLRLGDPRRRTALKIDPGERLTPHALRADWITEAYLNGALDWHVIQHGGSNPGERSSRGIGN